MSSNYEVALDVLAYCPDSYEAFVGAHGYNVDAAADALIAEAVAADWFLDPTDAAVAVEPATRPLVREVLAYAFASAVL